MKYKVIDEEGLALRIFPSKAEALAFLQDGWSVVCVPVKPKPSPLELVGDCLI
jgi:hypothetical protein